MATPSAFDKETVALLTKHLATEYVRPNAFIEMLSRRPTREQIIARTEADVAKLRSLSEAGRKWLVAKRLRRLNIGPDPRAFYFTIEGGLDQ